MPVPKKRTSRSKNRSRRAHRSKASGSSVCPNCGSKIPSSVVILVVTTRVSKLSSQKLT